MPMIGYESNKFVKESYEALRQLIADLKEGELVDLIGQFQIVGGFNEDKSREYICAAISRHWIEVSNHGRPISTLQAKSNLKYLAPVHFRSLLGKMEKRFNVEKMEQEMRQVGEEPPESQRGERARPESIADYALKKRQEIIKRNLAKLGYK